MPDENVAIALRNWAPRFTAGGVDASDFARVTGGIEHWEEWCAAWSAAAAEHEELGRRALAAGRTRSAGEHLAQAALYYHFGKFLFVGDLDQMRTAHGRAVACLTSALPHLDPPGRRVEIGFDGATLAGVLRLPAARPAPVVLLVPGLDSTKEEFRLVERSFLDRGVGTFAVDGPGQGEAEYDLPIRPDWEVPGAAIIDAVAALDGVDAARIGVWGVSLGGYYAPRVALDARVRACIALAGPYDFGTLWDIRPGLSREAFRVRSHAGDDAEARAKAARLTLNGVAPRVTCPLLVVAGGRDPLVDWHQAERLAAEAPDAELLMLPEGNHGCTNMIYRHRPYAADWMARHLTA
jgi:2,6-dihydroxypseudooxynicotine hydrolase